MEHIASDPEREFAALVHELLDIGGVTPPTPGRGFGSSALRVNGKIFAMLVRGRLVVKLPRSRVDALVGSGEGERFDANKGTPMKEWLTLSPLSSSDWRELAHEALAFVAG